VPRQYQMALDNAGINRCDLGATSGFPSYFPGTPPISAATM
jgi:hypothetical protein